LFFIIGNQPRVANDNRGHAGVLFILFYIFFKKISQEEKISKKIFVSTWMKLCFSMLQERLMK